MLRTRLSSRSLLIITLSPTHMKTQDTENLHLTISLLRSASIYLEEMYRQGPSFDLCPFISSRFYLSWLVRPPTNRGRGPPSSLVLFALSCRTRGVCLPSYFLLSSFCLHLQLWTNIVFSFLRSEVMCSGTVSLSRC